MRRLFWSFGGRKSGEFEQLVKIWKHFDIQRISSSNDVFWTGAVVTRRWWPYRAGVVHGLDEGVVVVWHFFVVGAEEAQSLVVVVGFSVEPGDGLVADVGEVLSRCRTQQLQERHLDAGDGVLLDVHVWELLKWGTLERYADAGVRPPALILITVQTRSSREVTPVS